MNDTPHKLLLAVWSRQGHPANFCLACIAFLLIATVAFLGLMAQKTIPQRPRAGTEEEVARVARQYQGAHPPSSLQEILAHPDPIPSHRHPLLGRQAPDFELADPDGKTWNLRQRLASGPVVLIFYYGYQCDHCVRQLFNVNRDMVLFREVGAQVVAISADPAELTRRRFQEYGRFCFPVLSDPANKVAHTYQVLRDDLLRHATFIIDGKGAVQWVNVGDAPFRRNSALLCHLARMEDDLVPVPPGQ